MNSWNLLWGLLGAVVGGAVIQRVVIDKGLWGYMKRLNKKLSAGTLEGSIKDTKKIPIKEPGSFSWLLGMLERLLYVISFVGGAPEWVAVWLTLKTIVKWKGWTEDNRTFNIYLIGNSLSIVFALLGAWIAVGFSLLDFLAMIKR